MEGCVGCKEGGGGLCGVKGGRWRVVRDGRREVEGCVR